MFHLSKSSPCPTKSNLSTSLLKKRTFHQICHFSFSPNEYENTVLVTRELHVKQFFIFFPLRPLDIVCEQVLVTEIYLSL